MHTVPYIAQTKPTSKRCTNERPSKTTCWRFSFWVKATRENPFEMEQKCAEHKCHRCAMTHNDLQYSILRNRRKENIKKSFYKKKRLLQIMPHLKKSLKIKCRVSFGLLHIMHNFFASCSCAQNSSRSMGNKKVTYQRVN